MSEELQDRSITNKYDLRPDNAAFSAGSTGGVTMIINFIIISNDLVQPESLSMTLGITPIIGIVITWVGTYIWREFGLDPSRVKIRSALKRAAKNALKDMKDDHLSEQAKMKAREDYEKAKEGLRLQDLNYEPPNPR